MGVLITVLTVLAALAGTLSVYREYQRNRTGR